MNSLAQPASVIEAQIFDEAILDELASEVLPEFNEQTQTAELTELDRQDSEFGAVEVQETVIDTASSLLITEAQAGSESKLNIDDQIQKILEMSDETNLYEQVEYDLLPIDNAPQSVLEDEAEAFWSSMDDDFRAVDSETVSSEETILIDQSINLDFGYNGYEFTVEPEKADMKKPTLVDIVQSFIETTTVAEPEKTAQLIKELEAIKDLSGQITELEALGTDEARDQAIQLRAELKELVEQLLSDLGMELDDIKIKRFIERILEEKNFEYQESAISYEDEGTHEKKTNLTNFMQNVTDGIDASKNFLFVQIGRFALN